MTYKGYTIQAEARRYDLYAVRTDGTVGKLVKQDWDTPPEYEFLIFKDDKVIEYGLATVDDAKRTIKQWVKAAA